MRFGLLLPHFGEHADAETLVTGAKTAESLGFDSVWVRDHFLFEPHGEFEKPNATFYEALTVLTAVGMATTSLQLGTGALIPFRHPLNTASIVATMTQFLGPRIVLGLGTGNFDREFAAAGYGGVPRVELVRKNAGIMRGAWSEAGVSWHDDVFSFDRVAPEPRPVGGAIPLWYCGGTPRSVRLAAETFDGWMPGRISLPTLRKRVRSLEDLSAEHGRKRPSVGIIPTASIDRSRDVALSRVDIDGLLAWANNAKFWVKPASGRFESLDDLRGLFIHGTPDDVLEQCEELRDAGVDHLVFDFRLSVPEWEKQMVLLGEHVLPRLSEQPTRRRER